MSPGGPSRRRLLAGLGGAALVAALPRPARADAWARWPLPAVVDPPRHQALNALVVDTLRSYGFGTLDYRWAPGMHVDGTTRDLHYRGVQLAEAAPDGAVHCAGITFEVWLRALTAAGPPPGLGPAQLLALKEHWYVRTGDERGLAHGLVALGLGLPVPRLEDLAPGDLVQFWRNSGRGHCAVVVDHTRRRDGSPRGLACWSAQAASAGIGIRYVSPGPTEHQLAPGRLYGVRPVVPRPGAAARG